MISRQSSLLRKYIIKSLDLTHFTFLLKDIVVGFCPNCHLHDEFLFKDNKLHVPHTCLRLKIIAKLLHVPHTNDKNSNSDTIIFGLL